MTNETIVLQSTDALDQSLVKENITDKVISKLKADYSGLTISGIDDKEGYKKVDEARREVKRVRIMAEKICDAFVAESHSVHKQRTAKRKEILSQFEDIERPLIAAQKAVDDEVKRLAEKAEQERKEKNAKRIKDLQAYNYQGDLLVIEFLSDDQFSAKLSEVKSAYEAEQARIAEEKRLREEEAARLEKQRLDQEAREKELQRQENERIEAAAKLKAEQDAKEKEIADRERAVKDAEEQIKREKELEEARKIAAEKALKDAEEKRVADELAAKEKAEKEIAEMLRLEALKSTKERLTSWVAGFNISVSPFSSTENETVKTIFEKHAAFKTWAQKEVDSLS